MEFQTLAAQVAEDLTEFARCIEHLRDSVPDISKAAELMCSTITNGGKVLFCGNGGSAADSQHLAAELMGRYRRDRHPMAAISLTVDTSALTAIGNDYGYDDVFSRQVQGLGRSGDLLVGISTSGNSRNVLKALRVARDLGLVTVGLTGETGGEMKTLCDVCIRVPSNRTNRIQEMHILVGHFLCGYVEESLC